VACVDEEPISFISLLDTFIGGIFVSPARQGLGIGRQLISHPLNRKVVEFCLNLTQFFVWR